MIVQTMAIEHGARLRSMTSIMSTTGEAEYWQYVPEVRAAMMQPLAGGRDEIVAATAERSRLWSSPRHFDRADAYDRAAAAYDRSYFPEGVARQAAAIRASGARVAGLRGIEVPTLVIHGRDDTIIKPCGGERTAEVVRGAVLLLVNDMSHDLPRPLWPLLTDVILSHTAHAAA